MRFYNCECVLEKLFIECLLSNLLVESRKTRFAEINARVSASPNPRILRRTALLSWSAFGFSPEARSVRCALCNLPYGSHSECSSALDLPSPFHRSKFGEPKLAGAKCWPTLTGSTRYRFTRSQRAGYAKFASENRTSERCENEEPSIAD